MNTHPTRPRWLLWSALAIVAVCVLYVASIGPYMRLEQSGMLSLSAMNACGVFYAPFWCAYDNFTAIRSPMESYIAWWIWGF